MKTIFRTVLDIVWYLVLFVLIQLIAMKVVNLGTLLVHGMDFQEALRHAAKHTMLSTTAVILSSGLSSALTMLIFGGVKWVPLSRSYVQSRPWGTLFWVVLLSLGTLIPSTWMIEQLEIDVPSGVERMLMALLGSPWGYLVVGVLTPIAEEMVFRGAILRTLRKSLQQTTPWIPIALSALIFGLAHGNFAQFPHAFLMGLLLGWMYVRTNSIIPGVVFHWINNSSVFILYNVLPQTANLRLVEIFGGSQRAVWLSLLFSLCIFLPALFQLQRRLHPAEEKLK